jgi:hypothetical protein
VSDQQQQQPDREDDALDPRQQEAGTAHQLTPQEANQDADPVAPRKPRTDGTAATPRNAGTRTRPGFAAVRKGTNCGFWRGDPRSRRAEPRPYNPEFV